MANVKEAKGSSREGGPQDSSSAFAMYKPDQGRYARLTSFWGLLIIGSYGCYQLFGKLIGFDSLQGTLIEGDIPVLGVPLSIALIIASGIWAVFAVCLYLFLNRPKSADLLIETEGELKKVTWPTYQETVNASLVVIGTVAFLGVFIMFGDILIGWVVDSLLFSRS